MNKTEPITPKAEFLLFAADRAQHMAAIIEPALAENKIVISDRMADSSLVYQGYARGLNQNTIETVNTWAMNDHKPDLTLYVDVSVDTGFERITARKEDLTAFEQQRSFMQQVQEGFEDLYKNRENVIRIDGEQEPATVCAQGLAAVLQWITNNA